MSTFQDEYQRFMDWLRETHPEIHEKYGRNITIPLQSGGGVSVTNDFKITDEEYDMLYKIANSYYQRGEAEESQ